MSVESQSRTAEIIAGNARPVQPQLRPIRRVLLAVSPSAHRPDLAAQLSDCAPRFQIETASDAAEALGRLTSAAPGFDLVACDAQLADASGSVLVARARQRGVDVPFIFLIPPGDAAAAREALRGGASDFLDRDEQAGAGLAVRAELAIDRHQRKPPSPPRPSVVGRESDLAAALRGSDQRLKTALAAGHLSLWAWDLRTHVTHFSGHWKTPLGYGDDEIDDAGTDWETHCHPDDLVRIKELTARYLAKPWPNFTSELRMRHKDGSWRWFLTRADLEYGEDRRPCRMIGWYIDITDLKHQQAELTRASVSLQKLSRRLLDVQETERRHLARELHDEIGQVLTATKIQFESAALHPAAGPVADHCREAASLLDRLLAQVRSLSLDLRPPLLDDLGLAAALHWLVEQQQARIQVPRVSLDADTVFARCDPAIEIACYRVAQEALTNALRHAHARTVTISLRRSGETLHLRVQDDGVGFDPEAARTRAERGGSLGLLSMHERISLTGGSLELKSSAQDGTRISAVFPTTVSPLPH